MSLTGKKLTKSSFHDTDHKDLEEPDRVQEVQEPLIEALRLYSRHRRPQEPLIFPQLVMKLYDLRTISMRGK